MVRRVAFTWTPFSDASVVHAGGRTTFVPSVASGPYVATRFSHRHRGCKDRHDQRHDPDRYAQFAGEVSARTPGRSPRGGYRLLQQAGSPELVQRQMDQVLVDRCLNLVVQNPGDFRQGRLPVTVAPDQSGDPVQAMCLVALEVIHERFFG
jgi:hypothetical protein